MESNDEDEKVKNMEDALAESVAAFIKGQKSFCIEGGDVEFVVKISVSRKQKGEMGA